MLETVAAAAVAAFVGGSVTGAFAAAALRTEIHWLTRAIDRHDGEIRRAHERIDQVERAATAPRLT